MENDIFSVIAGIGAIMSLISMVFGIIDHISKYAKDFRSQRKPLFFVHELHLIGFSAEQKQYQLNGRLVSKDEVDYESLKFEWDSKNHFWEQVVNCYNCNEGVREPKKNDITLTIEKNFNEKDTLKWESGKNEKLHTKRNYSYELEGEYVVTSVDNNKKEDKYIIKKDDITDLKIKAKVKDKNNDKNIKEVSVKPIKCPNIRNGWLIGYIIISSLVIFIGVISTSLLIYNWEDVFMRDDIGLKILFSIYGVLLVLTTMYFFVANMKCVSQLLVIIRMKKFGVPFKTKIVSDTLLIPKTWEFMAGTEKVDNIL